MKKKIYVVSRTITNEEVLQKKDMVTASQFRVTTYLQKLENAPDASKLQYAGLRFRG